MFTISPLFLLYLLSLILDEYIFISLSSNIALAPGIGDNPLIKLNISLLVLLKSMCSSSLFILYEYVVLLSSCFILLLVPLIISGNVFNPYICV